MIALRQRLLEVFETEYQEHLEAIRKRIASADGLDAAMASADLTEATRCAHSLKGAARAVGLVDVEQLAHGLESLFNKVQSGEAELGTDLKQQVLDVLDEIEDRVVAAQSDGVAEPTAAPAEPEAAPSAGDQPASRDVGEPSPPRERPEQAAEPAAPVETPDRARPTSVRIDAGNLDRLLKSAGELHADMLSQGLGSQEVRAISGEIAVLEMNWARLWKRLGAGVRHAANGHGAARILEAGESFGSHMKDISRRLKTAAQSQERCARSLRHHLDDLESRVKAARMVPVESVFGGFRKMVRDLAGSEGKQVEAAIDGLDCEADRIVLQRIKDPVMHMLRNAVSHGIEPPEERQAKGKAPKGCVSLHVSTERNGLLIAIEDDGRGIDFDKIADKAVNHGLISRDQAETANEQSLSQLLFEPGFSTAEAVTTISGRGVGLSVARESVAGLQGTLNVNTVPGKGTRIEVWLPISVLSRRLLLISYQGQTYALSADSVAKVLRVAVKDIVKIEGRPAISFKGETVPVVSIGEILKSGDSVVMTDTDSAYIVVFRNGGGHVGMAVDGFAGVNDFVVRTVDGLGDSKKSWAGAITTEDGAPCLVLNSDVLSTSEAVSHSAGLVFRNEEKQQDRAKVVLVVDDSITTRTLEKSILEAHGYKVRLSVDGRDAINQLRAEPADIVVSDIEMPHLNGFDLVRSIKQDSRLSDIPVILVTSRDDPADRTRGLELGAEAYVVKQRFDQADLLQTIKQMV